MRKTTYNKDTYLGDIEFTIYDTETTGANKNRKDYPIEVAVVKLSVEGVSDLKSWLIKPPIDIHPGAIAIHGLMESDLEGKPALSEVLPDIELAVQNTILCAHNDAFDLEMLPSFKDMPEFKIDTLRLAKKVYKIGELNQRGQDLSSMKLQEIRYWLDLDVDTKGESAHRASADVLVAAAVMEDMLNRAVEKTGLETIGQLMNFIEEPNLIEIVPFGKLKGKNTKEAIASEHINGKSWFEWLLRSETKENPIDVDFKHTIKTYKNELGIS